jgi:FMN phosphatase YigB (HAD superfamily)
MKTFKQFWNEETGKTKTVYFDMDGVLVDFDAGVKELCGNLSLKQFKQKVFIDKDPEYAKPFWDQFDFSGLKQLPSGIKILKFLKDKDVKIAILSSTGGPKHHEKTKASKSKWLRDNKLKELFDKIVFVPGAKLKKNYAAPNTFLIDDLKSNVTEFKEAGGRAILHKNYRTTMKFLKKFLEEPLE